MCVCVCVCSWCIMHAVCYHSQAGGAYKHSHCSKRRVRKVSIASLQYNVFLAASITFTRKMYLYMYVVSCDTDTLGDKMCS